MASPTSKLRESLWPHRWAVLLAGATFPLVWWGGFVAATGSGMAFRDWLTSDGVFMPAYPWLSSAGDKFIEHGHRLLGMLAGVLSIALVVVVWRCEPRRWVRGYSLGLLAGVVGQGILGGLRVLLDERLLALVHGCVGPLFFVATVGMATVTSRRWTAAAADDRPVAPTLVRLALLTAALAYLQLVLGAIVRHSPHLLSDNAAAIFQTATYFHVFMAAAVTFHLFWLAGRCWQAGVCVRFSGGLALLVVVQVLLGAGSWVVKYGMPSWATQLIGETGHFNRAADLASASILAAHGAVGSLIVALAAGIALSVGRRVRLAAPTPSAAPTRMRRALA
jgi:cytochrome c oxidase assembly protein subunit 15